MRDVLLGLCLVVVRNLAGKYAKECLVKLEHQQVLTPNIRKVILDGFNDLVRETEERFQRMSN